MRHSTTGSVLVAYATKNGSTAEIAQAIADTLRENGMSPQVRPVAEVENVTPYDAVVFGSGIYARRWLHDARRFAHRHRKALAERPV
jgi:menaquinone-dependent protoporphyrinogen oxidase